MSESSCPEWPKCQYCGNSAQLVTGEVVYPHRPDLYGLYFYRCDPCDAQVGCHKGTTQALGELADRETRRWRTKAHAVFDKIWLKRLEERQKINSRYNKGMARGGRYKALARAMSMTKEQCHIGKMDVAQCKQVIDICNRGVLD